MLYGLYKRYKRANNEGTLFQAVARRIRGTGNEEIDAGESGDRLITRRIEAVERLARETDNLAAERLGTVEGAITGLRLDYDDHEIRMNRVESHMPPMAPAGTPGMAMRLAALEKDVQALRKALEERE